MPFPVRLAWPDRKLGGFPRVSGYPYDGAVILPCFRLGRLSVALSCSVLDLSVGRLKWKANFGYVVRKSNFGALKVS